PDLHWYIRSLEQVLIDALAVLGIRAGRIAGRPGVWVDGRRKIASIGVGLRRWVTRHGFALNVAEDMSGFEAITPCGLDGVVMTSVAREGEASDVPRVAELVRDRFVARFGYAAWRPLDGATPFAGATP